MARLRKQMTFDDTAGNEVTLQETDISPYLVDPSLAAQESDLVKQRYGGSSIQDYEAAGGRETDPEFMPDPSGGGPDPGYGEPPPPFQPVEAGAKQAPVFNRSAFEDVVFKRLGGNPFEMDVAKKVDDVTVGDLPELFESVFQGQVTWEDRDQLSDEERKFWVGNVKAYRAHVKEGVNSERAAMIDAYNHLMTRFDNEQKEYAAAEKKVKSKLDAYTKQRDEKKKAQAKQVSDLTKERLGLLKELTMINADITQGKYRADDPETVARQKAIMARLGQINSFFAPPAPKSDVSEMPAGSPAAAAPAADPAAAAPAADPAANAKSPAPAADKKTKPGYEKQIVGMKEHPEIPNKMVVKYADGSFGVIDKE